MASLNKVMLIGNMTRDAELRYLANQTAVTDIGLAVNRYRRGENGERSEEVTFVDVTLWGRQAEVVQQYAGKGQPLFVEGRLQLDTWEDKQTGQRRSRLRVVGENIQLLGSAQGGGSSSTNAPRQPSAQPHQVPVSQSGVQQPPSEKKPNFYSADSIDDIDDIPF